MRWLYLVLFLLIVTASSAQTSQDDNSIIIQQGELIVEVTTNAPPGSDPLSFDYEEFISVNFTVFDPEIRTQIASQINVSISSSVFGDRGEIVMDMTTQHFSEFFQADLTSLSIGGEQLSVQDDNIEDQIFKYQATSNTTLSFKLGGEFLGLQLSQVNPFDITIVFSGFQPKKFTTGQLDIGSWIELLPAFSIDQAILPILAIGAALHLSFQSAGYSVKQELKDQEQKAQNVTNLLEEQESAITAARTTKETGEFIKDSREVSQLMAETEQSKWLSRWGRITFWTYFLFLSMSTIFYLLDPHAEVFGKILPIYRIYTITYLFLLFFIFIISYFRRSVLQYMGDSIPILHLLFIISGLIVFVVIPASYLSNLITDNNLEAIANVLLVLLISLTFVLLSLLSGYYLARSGISWSALLNRLLRSFRIPSGIRKVVSKLLTVVFFGIVLLKLSKTTALVLTVLLDSQLSNNAYLVTLAASYLNEEFTSSMLLVYGALIIFFMQSIMSIFLHLKKSDISQEPEFIPVYIAYRRFALFLFVGVLSFLQVIIVLEGSIEKLGISTTIYPAESKDTLNVWNLIFVVPPLKVLLDILLAIGLVVSLPTAIYRMWTADIDTIKR